MSWLRSPSCLVTLLLSSASLATAAHYNVTVGAGGQLKFDPETLYAQVGDQITYRFFAKNHSVVQSTFADPCRPQAGGFFSGFVPNPNADVEAPTTFTIRVNNTKPVWIYCGQTNGDHCQNGMVHAINAPGSGSNTFDNFKSAAAMAQKPTTNPPGGLPVGGLRKLRIDVGFDSNLVFNPSNVTELPGTVVEFSFNPLNHSIVQSSFDAPCQPLNGGFSAPFIPTQQTPSGVTFEVVVNDTTPIWFYCAQTAKTHCQAGMVGSINAATSGDKTFDAFKALAAKAPTSNIQPQQPNVGVLKVNGTEVYNVGGAVFDATKAGWDPSIVTSVPAPGYTYSPYMAAMAGGSVPDSYGWTEGISDNATHFLQVLQFIDNLVAEILFTGHSKLTEGDWKGAYPDSITRTISSMLAQALIQRSAYIESLQHYNKPTIDGCKFNLDSDSLDDWLQTALTTMTLSLGTVMDVLTQVPDQDRWMVAPLATALGAKARMIALVNLMQNHMAASAPREVLVPSELAVGYAYDKYVANGSCGASANDSLLRGKAGVPGLDITARETEAGTGRLTGVAVALPSSAKGASSSSSSYYLAWIGPWGGVKFSDVTADGKSSVPYGLSGHVWVVLTSAKGLEAKDISGSALSGMERVWVTDPWAHTS